MSSWVTAPSEEHLRVWRKMRDRLRRDLEMKAGYMRAAIRRVEPDHVDVEGEPAGDAGYYALRAWAADRLVEAFDAIPEPELAPDPRRGMAPIELPDGSHLPLNPALPTVVVGGIAFQRKVCDAGMDGECWGVGCPQADPATRQNFCPLPTGNPWMALRES